MAQMAVQPSVQLLRHFLGQIAAPLVLASIATSRAYRRIRLASPRVRITHSLAASTLVVLVLLGSGLMIGSMTILG